jgi:WD40 repeat protein
MPGANRRALPVRESPEAPPRERQQLLSQHVDSRPLGCNVPDPLAKGNMSKVGSWRTLRRNGQACAISLPGGDTLSAPADRIVEVIGDYGKLANRRYRLGSGCIVAGRVVLTAAHVVSGAESVIVRDTRKRIMATSWSQTAHEFVGSYENGGPDLALVELADPGINFRPMLCGKINRDGELGDTVARCVALGYPLFAQRPNFPGSDSAAPVVRDVAQAWGRIPVHSMRVSGYLSLTVSSAPRPLPERSFADSEWSGMSGAPVIADGCLVGVVTEHAPREGPSTITVTPLTALEASPRFPRWGKGVDDPASWWRKLGVDERPFMVLPRPRGASRYLSNVEEIHIRNGFLREREREIGELVSFSESEEGYRLIVGEQYAGKTALLAEFVTTRLPAGVDVVSYFLSKNEGDADKDRFLAAVVPQLAEILGVPAPEAAPYEFRALWQEAARQASSKKRHLLLVVDGLDEDLAPPGSASIAEILPSAVAGFGYREWHCAHVLTSMRLNCPLPVDIPHNHPLRKVQPTSLAPYAEASVYETLAKQEIDSLKAIGPDAKRFLGVLAAAAGPLEMEDIRELTSLTEEAVDQLVSKMQRSLRASGQQDTRRYSFGSTSLLQRAQADSELYIPRHRASIHEWAERWQHRRWKREGKTMADVPLYLLDAYPKTLGDQPQLRASLVSDAAWVTAAINRITVDLVLAELRTCVAATPGFAGPAGMLAVVRGQASLLRSTPGLAYDQVLRQLCLQAGELHEPGLACEFREPLSAYLGLIPQWTSRRPHRALAAEINGHAGRVNAVALTKNGTVVVGAEDGRILIWNPSATVVEPATLGRHDGPVRALVVDQSGRIVSGGHDHRIRRWDPILTGAKPTELGRHDGPVRALAIDEDGRVISGGDDARVLVWDERGPDAGPTELGRHVGVVRCLAVSPGGWVASGGDDHRVRLWNLANPALLVTQTDPLGGRIMTIAFAPDRTVIAGSTDSVLYRWRPQFSDPTRSTGSADQSHHRLAELGSHHGAIRAVTTMRGTTVVSGGDDGRVLFWQTSDRGAQRIEIGRHDGPVRSVTDASDDRAVSGGQDQRVRLWDLREPMATASMPRIPTDPANAVCIMPDGCVVSSGTDKRIWLWDSPGTTEPEELGRHDSPVAAIAALNGNEIASCGTDGRLLLWDRTKRGGPVAAEGNFPGAVLCALAGGNVAIGGYDGRIFVWNVAQGSRPRALGAHPGPIAAVVPLEDGRIASGGIDGNIRIWDPGSGDANWVEMERYNGRLNALEALSGYIVGGGDDGVMCMWNMAGHQVGNFAAHGSWLTSIVTLRNRYVISGGTDSLLIVWDAAGGSLRRINSVTCSVRVLAAGKTRAGGECVVVAHADSGISYWTLNVPS